MATDRARTLALWPEEEIAAEPLFPATRYQGSKAKVVDWLMACMEALEFHSALDLFGGTGAVSYALKRAGKAVTYNDALRFNHQVGIALIENSATRLSDELVSRIVESGARTGRDGFVARTFHDIYYTDEENAWVDGAVKAIRALPDKYQRALAYWALFQSCIAKRPFNLFHRKNLYIRTADVQRSFGNKTTWDKPFAAHFRAFAAQASRAVFDNGRWNRAVSFDAGDIAGDFDLVYMDPPYISAAGVGVDYHHFYHFLEGLVRYDEWETLIDRSKKHLPLRGVVNPWTARGTIEAAFVSTFRRFPESVLAVSYRDDGFPSPQRIAELLEQAGRSNVQLSHLPRQYVLSKTAGHEILFVSEP